MSRFILITRAVLACLAVMFAIAAHGAADQIARLADGGVSIRETRGTVEIRLGLTRAVPWRLADTGNPSRIALQFSEVDWTGLREIGSEALIGVDTRRAAPAWTEIAFSLAGPHAVASAEMRTETSGSAELVLTLAAHDTVIEKNPRSGPAAAVIGEDRVRVALDPGHGGVDPGAEADGLVEAEIVLSFALRLKEALIRTGRFDVVLTRTDDTFVPLSARMTRARGAGAQVFLSIHADALPPDAGQATGVIAYTLSDDQVAMAARLQTERHAPSDMLRNVDLGDAENDVALALMDLARAETLPRSEALAADLLAAFGEAGLETNSRPHRHGGFNVLRSAGTPSVLLELGFLSNATDRDRLTSEAWLEDAAEAVRDGLLAWEEADRLQRALYRQ
ncbi:MAG: N-acetylmuramoyl-L-alanine amidase [Paracoccaceae bacterium]|nr:N-acetylmuramoyl-L-alanine amidase [Paracoccaceae bacterium]